VKPLTASYQTSSTRLIKKTLMLAILVGLGFAVYSQWSVFVSTVVEWQKELHSMLASHIRAVSENVFKYGGALVALSFAYGVFHAVGPGHGKAVIVTYLGTNKESVRKGIYISFAAAILQSVIAIILVSALARVLKLRLAEIHNYGNDMALVSYVLVIILGLMLVIGAMRRMLSVRSFRSEEKNAHKHEHHDHSIHHHDHSHGSECGCSHTHVPEEKQSIWQTLTVILSMGFRPCSGAIVVLIYAHLVGVYAYGVIATLLMGLGTGLSVSLIAIATLRARSWLERFVITPGEGNEHSHHAISHSIRFVGGAILIALGWSLYNAALVASSGHPLF
jgi:nickel/cobalt exporter